MLRISNLRKRSRGVVRQWRRLDGVGGLRSREETVGDMVHPDGKGGMSVINGFGASCFRKKAFSCCNLRIPA